VSENFTQFIDKRTIVGLDDEKCAVLAPTMF